MSKSALIIFVKNPEIGKAKTRLAKTIGDEKALAIYKLLLQKTHDSVINSEVDVQIHYSSFIDNSDLWENEHFSKHLQINGDLGEKMKAAFQSAFSSGYKSVCIIGSDCYDLDEKIIKEAYAKLYKNDLVIGPSEDGGYYLLGMKTLLKEVFETKQWSTSNVFKSTVTDINSMSKSYGLLPVLSDVDVEADLGEWAKEILNNE